MTERPEWEDDDWGFFNFITRFSFVLLFAVAFFGLLVIGAVLPAVTAGLLLLILIVLLWAVPARWPKTESRWVHKLRVIHTVDRLADAIFPALRASDLKFESSAPPLWAKRSEHIYTLKFEEGMSMWIAPDDSLIRRRGAPPRSIIVLSVSPAAPEKLERKVLQIVREAIPEKEMSAGPSSART
jgi:hypothetical protein